MYKASHLGDSGVYFIMFDLQKRYGAHVKAVPKSFAFHLKRDTIRSCGFDGVVWDLSTKSVFVGLSIRSNIRRWSGQPSC
jgi:hypothetical protein